MDRKDARQRVEEFWQPSTERYFGCPAEIDDSLTEEYEWGWAFCFVPTATETGTGVYPQAQVAIDKRTGHSTPVGTKGIEEAVHHLESLQRLYPRNG
jgi:hypothetical protein